MLNTIHIRTWGWIPSCSFQACFTRGWDKSPSSISCWCSAPLWCANLEVSPQYHLFNQTSWHVPHSKTYPTDSSVHPGVLDYPLGLVFTTASLFLLFSSFNSCLVSQGMQFLLGQKKSLAQGSDLTNSRSKVSPGLSTNLT